MKNTLSKHIYEASLSDLDANQKKWEDYDTIVCPDGSIIDMRKLVQKMGSIKAALNHLVPEFQGFIQSLNFKYTFQVSTQATDGFSIYINPQFTVQHLDDDTKKFAVMLHEVMHCVLNHLRRGKGHDPEKSNVAADYEVNDTLSLLTNSKGRPLVSPSTWKSIGALYDPKYNNLGYETIYGMNPPDPAKGNMDNQQGAQQAQKNQPKNKQQGQQSQQGQQGQGDQQGNQQGGQGDQQGNQQGGQGNQQDQQDQQGSQGGQGNQQGAQQGGQGNQQGQKGKGSNQGSGFKEGQQGRDDPDAKPGQNQGRVRPEDCMGQAAKAMSKVPSSAGGMINKETGDQISESEGYEKDEGTEGQKAEDFAKMAERMADEVQKKQGKGQGWADLASRINNLNRSTHNWKKILRDVVGHALNKIDKDQRYLQKRRMASTGDIMRTDKDKYDAVSDIVAMIDTSGSMSDKYILGCLRQVYDVARKIKPVRMVIIPFDDGPSGKPLIYKDAKKMESDIKAGRLHLKGGGGTDVRPCFKLLQTDKEFKGHRFELVMVFTDGALDEWKRDPRLVQHLVWVISNDFNWTPKYKDAGRTQTIYMDTKDFEDL